MDDFDALYAVLSDGEIMHYPYTFGEKRVKDWIERNMKRYEEYGLKAARRAPQFSKR